MELMTKRGFKQTEVGLIPEDWIVREQREVVRYINGRAYSISEWETHGIPVVRLQNLTQKGGNFYYSNLNLPEHQYMYNGDLIFMWSASFGPYIWWGEKAIYHYHIWKIECDPKKADKLFYYHKLAQLTDELKKGTSGSTMLHLTKHGMEKYVFALPPTLTEQKAIASALSDVDELISSLEKLIVKKKAFKQGAMQQLLTPPSKGGKRLPGFSGEWEERPLTEMVWFQEGPGLRKWQFTSKGIKVINITNLVNGVLDLDRTQRHISWNEFNKMYRHFEIDENDILVASSGNSYCKTSVVRERDLPLLMNTSVIRFKPLDNLNYRLLVILLKSNLFKEQIDLLITGGAQPNFGPAHLPKVFFTLPKSLDEQKAIAQILFDMDIEIEALESKKAKYQDIKQGMMQELLTGKTRLV